MKTRENNSLLVFSFFWTLVLSGLLAEAIPYDYSATIECLEKPLRPQYNGGIIVNPELNEGLKGWSTFGGAKIEHRESGGNRFILAHSRNQSHDSVSQKLYLKKNLLYTLSAWVRVTEGSVIVTATVKTATGFRHTGAVLAQSNCWSMLKGGLSSDASGPAELYFESNTTSVDIWIDSVSLQPFTAKQWKSHQVQSIEKIRKSKVRIRAVDRQGKPLSNATVFFAQKKLSFPFGCAINKNILSNTAYQNWFAPRFTVTTFEDEMKWYSTEAVRGRVDYSVADAMLSFAKQHGISVRGHNVLWDDPNFQPGWVKSLSPQDLQTAALARTNSVVSRYKSNLIAWDVVNENLHYNFFESKVGPTASAVYYNAAAKADPTTTLFMNEYNTVESKNDGAASVAKYLQKLKDIRGFPGNQNLRFGIGLESHFGATPDLAFMRSAIDTLAAANVPIWLTEVDVQGNNQAQLLEQILREAHAHPKVSGIVMWSAWSPKGCYRMCLTDNNFKNLPTGDVVDKLLREWGSGRTLGGTTDADGFFEGSLSHGDYDVEIRPSGALNSTTISSLKVDTTDDAPQSALFLQVTA